VHRDIKPDNILLAATGEAKLSDFGTSREFSDSANLLTVTGTPWFMAPEVVKGSGHGAPADMWSIGCIFAELVLGHPIFPGKMELEQLELIFKCLGMPSDHTWPGFKDIMRKKQLNVNVKYTVSKLAERFERVNTGDNGIVLSHQGFDLLSKMLHYDPKRRISAREALNHSWFREEPQACQPAEMPKFKSFNMMSREKRRKMLERQRKIEMIKEEENMGIYGLGDARVGNAVDGGTVDPMALAGVKL
jgi:cell division cycle 2-like protein